MREERISPYSWVTVLCLNRSNLFKPVRVTLKLTEMGRVPKSCWSSSCDLDVGYRVLSLLSVDPAQFMDEMERGHLQKFPCHVRSSYISQKEVLLDQRFPKWGTKTPYGLFDYGLSQRKANHCRRNLEMSRQTSSWSALFWISHLLICQ